MDMVSSIASLSVSMAQTRTEQAVGVTVLRKALDIEASTFATLLEAVAPAQVSSNLPPHLGQNINTTA